MRGGGVDHLIRRRVFSLCYTGKIAARRHLSRLPPRSALLPAAEVATGNPRPAGGEGKGIPCSVGVSPTRAATVRSHSRQIGGDYELHQKPSARSVESNAATGSHQRRRPQRTQCALGKVAVRQSALTEGVDRLGAEESKKQEPSARSVDQRSTGRGRKQEGKNPAPVVSISDRLGADGKEMWISKID